MTNKSGYTVIELIIVMLIVTIIMGVVVTIFSTSTNIFNKVDLNSELQLEAQKFDIAFMDIAFESKGIDVVNSTFILDGNGDQNVVKLVLLDGLDDTLVHVFTLNNSILNYSLEKISENGVSQNLNSKLISKYVKKFIVEPKFVDGTSPNYIRFNIEFTMTRGKNTDQLLLSNQVVFRNFN